MSGKWKRLHPVMLPSGFLFVAFMALLQTAQGPAEQRVMLILMAFGIAALACVYMVLDHYLDRLTMAAQGFPGEVKRLEKQIEGVSSELHELRRIPAIKRALVQQREREARESLGPDSSPDAPRIPDDLLPPRQP